MQEEDGFVGALVGPKQHYPLTELSWQRHKGTAIAAVLVLMALSIRLNQSRKEMAPEPNAPPLCEVAVSLDDLRDMTGLARITISNALMLLEGLEAISRQLVGRKNVYTLRGVESNSTGTWSMLPQGTLLRAGELTLKTLPRNRNTLHALKVYLVLLRLRSTREKNTSVSYTGLVQWSGVRREEIHNALGTLSALGLIYVSFERDSRHAHDASQRYGIVGLGPVVVGNPADPLLAAKMEQTLMPASDQQYAGLLTSAVARTLQGRPE